MNYWDYIRVEELLKLQGGKDGDESKLTNHEVVFITVHQVYELWFKLALRETITARDLFRKKPVPDVELSAAVRSFKRISAIFEQAAAHFKVVETLTTRDYLEFRDQLIPASGFQSAQVRELEVLLGLEEARRVPLGKQKSFKEALKGEGGAESVALRRVEARIADTPTLKDAVYEWLARTPIYGGEHSEEGTVHFLKAFLDSHRADAKLRLERAMAVSGTAVEADEVKARYEREMANAEAFLFAEDDPAASPEAKRRRRDVRALLATLFMSRGMPLIQQGDEMGRTQRGNNNAYAQDNEITWLDWEGADGDLVDFVAAANTFRRAHAALTHDHFLDGKEKHGIRDVVWWHQDGREMNHDDWSRSGQSVLGMQLRTATDEILVWFNRHAESITAILPDGGWALGLASDDKTPVGFTGRTVHLPPRSVVALIRAQIPKDEPLEIPPAQEPPATPEEDPVQIPPDNPNEEPPVPVEEPPPDYPDELPPGRAN